MLQSFYDFFLTETIDIHYEKFNVQPWSQGTWLDKKLYMYTFTTPSDNKSYFVSVQNEWKGVGGMLGKNTYMIQVRPINLDTGTKANKLVKISKPFEFISGFASTLSRAYVEVKDSVNGFLLQIPFDKSTSLKLINRIYQKQLANIRVKMDLVQKTISESKSNSTSVFFVRKGKSFEDVFTGVVKTMDKLGFTFDKMNDSQEETIAKEIESSEIKSFQKVKQTKNKTQDEATQSTSKITYNASKQPITSSNNLYVPKNLDFPTKPLTITSKEPIDSDYTKDDYESNYQKPIFDKYSGKTMNELYSDIVVKTIGKKPKTNSGPIPLPLDDVLKARYTKMVNKVRSNMDVSKINLSYSDEERIAIDRFTSNDFIEINNFIRDGITPKTVGSNKLAIDYISETVKGLDSAFKNKSVELPSYMNLYRCMRPAPKSKRKEFFNNNPYFIKSFTSTSFSIQCASSFAYYIDTRLIDGDDDINYDYLTNKYTRYSSMNDIKHYFDSSYNNYKPPNLIFWYTNLHQTRVVIPGIYSNYSTEQEVIINRGTYIHLDSIYVPEFKDYDHNVILRYTFLPESYNNSLYESKRLDFTSFLREEREMKTKESKDKNTKNQFQKTQKILDKSGVNRSDYTDEEWKNAVEKWTSKF